MFRIGQKVVCVNEEPIAGQRGSKWDAKLKAGAVYVIRWAGTYQNNVFGPSKCVRLQGIVRDYADGDTPYCASRFRPVVEKSTDTGMAILKEILERETARDPVQATS